MSPPLRILLITDTPEGNPQVRQLFAQEFPTACLAEADDIQKFVSAVECGAFDLVVTDYKLSWTTGLAVLRTVKSRYPDCPVVMYTGAFSEDLVIAAMREGLDDYVTTGLHATVRLRLAVRSALEKARQRRQLNAAEARYRSLFDNVPIGLCRITSTGQFIDANPALVQLLGYPDREALLSVPVRELYVDPAEYQRGRALLERHGELRNFETQLRRYDDSVVWIQYNARAVGQTTDQTLFYEGSLADITAHKRADEALRDREERYRQLFQNANDGISVLHLTAEGTPKRFIEVNEVICRRLGYTRDELLQRSPADILAPESAVQMPFIAAQLLREGYVLFEAVHISKNGRRIPVEVNAHLFELRGQPAVLATARDITERKRAEEARVRAERAEAVRSQLEQELTERKKIEAALRQQEEYFRLLSNNAFDSVLVLNSNGTVRYRNPSAAQLFGRASEKALGKSAFAFIHPDDLPQVLRVFAQLIKTPGIIPPLTLRVRHDDDSWRDVEVRANNLLADPVIAGIIVNVRDVTERRQMEEALRESETLAALGRMAARVAHEINNPLAGVKNALLLIKDAISPTHPDVKYLSWADKEIDQIASIVRQMLTLQTPVREPAKECHADKVIRDVVALLTAGGRKSNVTVTLDLPTTPLVVCLAENSLRQLVFNLVAHAIEIAPPGGTVKIAVVASPEKLELTVVNHNNGLPAAPSTHYFEPVLPLQNGKSQGGLGIGVSVAKMLVEAMNGSFQHQHEGEKGAMVHVGLPLWSSRGMGRDD